MKRFSLSLLILLALVVGAAGAAQAAVGDPCDADGNAGTIQASGLCVPNNASTGVSCDADGNPGTLNAAGLCVPNGAVAASPTDPAAANTPSTYKGDTSPSSPYNFIMIKIMELFAWLLGVAALTLNYAAYYTVVTMGNYVNHLSAIGVTWRILRDIGNIMLIFGFLAVGITTILNVDWYGGGKKMLPMMLAAAVFLNFSLFISEAIIDTGNLFATQFYKQIVGGTLPTQSASGLLTTASGATLTTANEGISNAIMSKLGLPTIYGNGVANSQIFQGGNPWLIGFMGIILFIVTAFVMFSLAFVLIARFVALVFLIIVAPIGFAGLAIPGFAARAKDYWTTLFHQTITAPILLLMLYIALAVITDVQFLTGFGLNSANTVSGGWWTGFVNNANLPGFAGILLSFLVAMGLLLAVVVYSKRWSAFGGDWATRTAGKLSFGLAGQAARTGIGWPSNAAARYLRSTRFAQVPIVGTGLVRGLDKIAGSNFDMRGNALLKKAPFISQVDLGTAQKGGYKAELKARTEARTKYAADLTGKGPSAEQIAAKREADAKLASIAAQKNEAQQGVNAATQENRRLTAERDRLVEEKSKDKYWETNPENVSKLEAAERNLAGNTDALAKAQEKLSQATTDATAAQKEQKAADDAIGAARSGKGAQQQYAKNLELGYLGLDEHSWFNRYINFAANTDAAKKIRGEAKKSKTTKDLEKFVKSLEDSEKGETKPEEKKEEPKAAT